jgi:hypothetical protein
MSPANPKSRPAPTETDPGEQKDDNIDDLGRKPDGSRLDQPVDAGKGASDGTGSEKPSRD